MENLTRENQILRDKDKQYLYNINSKDDNITKYKDLIKQLRQAIIELQNENNSLKQSEQQLAEEKESKTKI